MSFRDLLRLAGCGLLVGITAGCSTLTERNQVRLPVPHRYAVGDPQFRRDLGALLGPGFVEGNRIDTLRNGDQIFPAMLAAIRGARHTVNLECYLFEHGAVADEFVRVMAERARAGVEVRVVLDWIGSSLGRENKRVLADAGVRLAFYHPPGFYDLRRLNNRTHRKLLVVDGTVGFIGGADIADQWAGDAQSPAYWRDTHYRVTGPVVAQMQANFTQNWTLVSGELLHGNRQFPPLVVTGHMLAQAVNSSPGRGDPAGRAAYLLAFAAASRSILIENPYFVPDRRLSDALVDARRRGVRVRIIVPGRYIDTAVTRRASRSRWGPLLAAGVEFFEFEPTMIHAKLLVVDGCWTSVGSSNVDGRSFRLNDEENLNVLDTGFATEQAQMFADDLARSHRVTLDEWRKRGLYEKITTPLRDLFVREL